MDRLLAGRATRSPARRQIGACLDAETLAAWADEALEARELAAPKRMRPTARGVRRSRGDGEDAPLAPAQAVAPLVEAGVRMAGPADRPCAAVLVWTILPNRGPGVRASGRGASKPLRRHRSRRRKMRPRRSQSFHPLGSHVHAGERDADVGGGEESICLARRKAPTLENRRRPRTKAENDKQRPRPPLAPLPARRRPPTGCADGCRDAAAAPAAAARAAGGRSRFGAPETIVVSSNPATRFRLMRGGGGATIG